MSALDQQSDEALPPFEVLAPPEQTVPLVFVSPHSGADYPAEFLAGSALDPVTLRRSEDSFVDELFAAAPQVGAPLLRANFPRAYLDPNREPWELDPAMFDGPLPDHVNSESQRVAGGLGTIPRVVASGAEIYREKLSFAEAERRVNELYKPFHATLTTLIDETLEEFGCAVLIDCHSMPAVGGPMDKDRGHERLEIVLGDRFGTSCARAVSDAAEETLDELGCTVGRNNPYAGGFITRNYGRPAGGIHALQIEIKRSLYMDERRIERLPRLRQMTGHMRRLIGDLAKLERDALMPPR